MSFLSRLLKFMVILLVLCAAGYFIIFNGAPIDVSFGYFGTTNVPAAVAYIISFAFGAAVVAAYFGVEFTKRSLRVKKLERRIQYLEGKVTPTASHGSLEVDNQR